MLQSLNKTQVDYILSDFNDLSLSPNKIHKKHHNAEINIINENGKTLLYEAVMTNNFNDCLDLLHKGADPNIQCSEGETVLFKAVEIQNKEIVALLLKYGANPNITLDEGITALHCSVINVNYDICRLLLENDANPNLQIKYSLQTPLHIAARVNSNKDFVRLLISFKALVTLIDKYDKKAIDYADSSEIKAILLEAESIPLIQISENNNTYHENTVFTLENRLDSFMTKEEDASKEQNFNLSEGRQTDRIDLDIKDSQQEASIKSILKGRSEKDAGNDINNKEIDDSLENDMSYSQSKEDYVSDFPFSSVKKVTEESEGYQNLMITKRLNFNNKISYHKNNNKNNNTSNTSNNNLTPRDNSIENNIQKTNIIEVERATEREREIDTENLSPNMSSLISQNINLSNHINTNDLLETCIHNCTEQFFTSNPHPIPTHRNSTNTVEIVPDSKSTSKRDSNFNHNNIYSTFSTQPQSNILNSLRSKKIYTARTSEQNSFEKISEFSLKSMMPTKVPSIQLNKMKGFLKSIKLQDSLHCFVNHDACDNDMLSQFIFNSQTIPSQKFNLFERIGFKRPGHIYRILTKLAMTNSKIDERIIKFIQPMNHKRTESQSSKNSLKISEEYCCGCNLFTMVNQLDLTTFLNKKNLIHLKPNFTHNGFDLFEYVLLQMFTEFILTEDIMEEALHIYDENDRKMLLRSLIEEKNKIELFVNSKEYTDNTDIYNYNKVDFEREELDPHHCLSCIIF